MNSGDNCPAGTIILELFHVSEHMNPIVPTPSGKENLKAFESHHLHYSKETRGTID